MVEDTVVVVCRLLLDVLVVVLGRLAGVMRDGLLTGVVGIAVGGVPVAGVEPVVGVTIGAGLAVDADEVVVGATIGPVDEGVALVTERPREGTVTISWLRERGAIAIPGVSDDEFADG